MHVSRAARGFRMDGATHGKERSGKMTQRSLSFTLCTATALLLALPALARSSGGSEIDARVHVVEPWMLEKLGYPKDATNVYATPEVVASLRMTADERAAITLAAAANEKAGEAGRRVGEMAFGNTSGISTIHATDFMAQSPPDTIYPLFGIYLSCITSAGVNNANYRGVFRDVPHGASVRFRRIWYYDDDPNQDLTVSVERVCLPFSGEGDAEVTVLRTDTSSGTPGFGRFGPGTSIEEDADTLSCVYTLRARLSDNNFCDLTSANSLRIYKASLSWRRQVSEAPAIATFDDVPTNHPFFQHIEALAGADISTGCGADNFCPDAPVTRGQMALFLAKALGLDWDGPFWEPAP